MKSILLILSFVFAFSVNAQVEKTEVASTKKVDTESSTVGWKGHKVTGTHEGTINVSEGSLTYDKDGMLNGGSILIDMTSITCTDLEGEYAGKLVGHLASPDFFAVENFPTAKLEILRVAPKGTPGDYKIVANLTIKETTKEITFYANVADGMATADITIDRTDFDVRYGSSTFFGALGDKTIYDDFDLTIKLAVK